MMREFGKPDTPVNETLANIGNIEPKPQEGIVRLDDNAPAEGLRPFHAEMEDEEGNNTAKIIGGLVVGLLIIGGGIYAYESTRSMPAPQQVALKTPAVNQPALDQTAAVPPAPTPDNAAPQPAPAATAPAKPKTSQAIKSASKRDENSMASAAPARAMAASADSAINAPMTLTPENAPPPEQSAPTGQTAMQQPVTAPNVSGPAAQPTPEIANNNAALPAPVVAPQLPAPQLPADQPAPAQ